MNFVTRALFAAFAFALIGGSACSNKQDTKKKTTMVEAALDGSWISVRGTVVEAGPHNFLLDYGAGQIVVEMDDWDWIPEGRNILTNDKVVVYGYIDDDFFEKRTIEASSVFVRNIQTQFYASGIDEEDFQTHMVVDFHPRVELTGKVVSVEDDEFELELDVGRTIEVDTDEMAYDPLDKEGYQQIKPGDRVRVSGTLDNDIFNEREVEASYIVTLKSAKRSDAKLTEKASS